MIGCLLVSVGSYFLLLLFNCAMGKGVYAFAIYGGVVLFSALLLYQTQQVVAVCEKTPSNYNYDPIIMSTGIYMSTINLFTRILMIMQGNKRKTNSAKVKVKLNCKSESETKVLLDVREY
eukprot:sb/3476221/